MSGLVSVVIPTYNYARYLPEAINSVLRQSVDCYEIIVVDDGSTDDTKEVARLFGQSIRYIYQENQGLASAYNRGIKAARGDFIAFLDSDDLWLPHKLERQLRLFESDPDLGMVICNGFYFDQTGTTGTFFPPEKNDPIPEDLHTQLFLRNIIPGNTPLIRSRCFDRIGLHDESLTASEDLDMWIRFTRHYRVGYVPEPLVKYRRHPEAMSLNTERMCENNIKVINQNLVRFSDGIDKSAAIRKRLSDLHFELAGEKIKNKCWSSALDQLAASIRQRPLWLTPILFLYYRKLRKNMRAICW